MTLQEASSCFHLDIEMLRLYEESGFIRTEKTESGEPDYPEAELRKAAQLCALQRAGMELEELKKLCDLQRSRLLRSEDPPAAQMPLQAAGTDPPKAAGAGPAGLPHLSDEKSEGIGGGHLRPGRMIEK